MGAYERLGLKAAAVQDPTYLWALTVHPLVAAFERTHFLATRTPEYDLKQAAEVVDVLFLLIGAWAVLATSLKGDSMELHPRSRGYFNVRSACDDARFLQGEIAVTPWDDGTYTLTRGKDCGFPTDIGRAIELDSKDGKSTTIISLDGDNLKDNLLNTPMPFHFFAIMEVIRGGPYDNPNSLYREETMELKKSPEPEPSRVGSCSSS